MRLPRIASAALQVAKEIQWLPRLASHLPLMILVPLAKGSPGEGYPWEWSVCRWIDGENATLDRLAARPYYLHRNPPLASIARHAIDEASSECR